MIKVKVTEIFGGSGKNPTIQGEGVYTGMSSVFVRFAGCTLRCPGFGQKNPTDPSTYVFQELPVVQTIEELPIITHGCDSIYSVDPKYKKFFKSMTTEQAVDEIINCNVTEINPEGWFCHPITNQSTHLVFTGGEPMLWQPAMLEILGELWERDNLPEFVTIETNGTVPVTQEFIDGTCRLGRDGMELMYSCSPKLFCVSGEPHERAFKPEALRTMYDHSDVMGKGIQFKFVSDGSEESFKEIEDFLSIKEVEYAVNYGQAVLTVMAVGSTAEQQFDIQARVCEQALRRGYHFSARVHSIVFGNTVGK